MPGTKASKGKGKSEVPGQQKKKNKSKDDDSDAGSTDGAHSFETLRDEASHFMHTSQFDRAIEVYNQALEMKQEDKNCLVSRSKCYLQMGNAKLALEDAEKALAEDKDFNRGIACKAEALYHLGNFELALVFYHRGHKLRPEQQEFRLGIQKSQEAIENSIGTPETVKLRSDGDLSFFWEAQQEDKPAKKKAGAGRYRKPGQKQAARQEKRKPKNHGNDKTIKQLLGQLYADREFLEKIYNDEENNNRMTKISATIQELALEGIDYLDSRTEFWRQQKPMYSRKRDKEMRDRDARRGSGKGARGDAAKYVLKNLEEIDQAQTDGRHEDALKQSRSVLKTVDKWSDEDLPNRQEVIANLHSCMGNSLLEKGEYEKSVKHHQKDLELAEEHDLPDAKSRAMDNLGRVYARMGKFEDAIEIWNDKVPLSKSALETTWLYHEIGRCHLELGQHEKAKDFGERSLAAAQEAEDNVWQLNASVLIAQAEVKCGDYQSAVDSFERSLEMAKAQGDTEAERAIKKALEDVNDKIVKGLKGEEDSEEKTDTDAKKQENDDQAPEEDDQAPEEDGYDQDFEDEGKKETADKDVEKEPEKDPENKLEKENIDDNANETKQEQEQEQQSKDIEQKEDDGA